MASETDSVMPGVSTTDVPEMRNDKVPPTERALALASEVNNMEYGNDPDIGNDTT